MFISNDQAESDRTNRIELLTAETSQDDTMAYPFTSLTFEV